MRLAGVGVIGLGRLGRNVAIAACLLLAPYAAEAAPTLAAGVSRDTIAAAIEARLSAQPAAYGSELATDWGTLQRFYRGRAFRPAWIGNPATDAALAALGGVAADGLDPADYHGAALAMSTRLKSDADAARYDLVLTDGLLRYARDVRNGLIASPTGLDRMVDVARPAYDAAGRLATALELGRVSPWLAALPPEHPEYARLKAALARYRDAVAKGGWPAVPGIRKIALKDGNPELGALRSRLAAEDAEVATAGPVDIDSLVAAVKRFQSRNGLEADGVVGRKTIEALNVSTQEQVARIEANMERWRWLPHSFPARYIAVNTADATLKAVDNGKTLLTSRVIVGKPKTETPLFSAQAVALTINPYWNVPSSIARSEILPKLRRNPAYLATHHMEMVDGRIRQKPGDDNALGYLKVEMPNPFTSYLHDTSSRRLLARDERHLSHGCIRVQNIRPLASWLLTGDTEKGLARIQALIDTGVTRQIGLDRQVAVYVLYWTVIAHDDGTAEFRPDVYGRDKRLIAALAGRPEASSASMDGTDCAGWG